MQMQKQQESFAATLMRWSIDDYHRLISTGVLEGRRVELIQGNLIEMAPEGPMHSAKTSSGSEYLRERTRGLAIVREAHPITLSDSEPEPDIALVRGTYTDYQEHHPYPEDIFLLVEISKSTLAYDLSQKKQTYAEAGIPEYWVLDVEKLEVHVFQHPVQTGNSADYSNHKVIRSGSLQLAKIPEIVVDISAFIA